MCDDLKSYLMYSITRVTTEFPRDFEIYFQKKCFFFHNETQLNVFNNITNPKNCERDKKKLSLN